MTGWRAGVLPALVALTGLLLFGGAVRLGHAHEEPAAPSSVREVVRYERSGDVLVERTYWIETAGAADPDALVESIAGPETRDGVATAQYTINSHRWPSSAMPVKVYYNGLQRGSNPDAAPIIQTDIARWNAVTDRFSFIYAGATSQATGACNPYGQPIDSDGFNTIAYSTRLNERVLGSTCTLFGGPNAPIAEFDMEINANGLWSDGASTPIGLYDLYSTMLHELGHAAGIGHPCQGGSACTPDERASVMWAFLDDGIQKRALTPDDIAALQAQYPGGAAPTPTPTPVVIPQFQRDFQAIAVSLARD